jgi:hypothetical protein
MPSIRLSVVDMIIDVDHIIDDKVAAFPNHKGCNRPSPGALRGLLNRKVHIHTQGAIFLGFGLFNLKGLRRGFLS